MRVAIIFALLLSFVAIGCTPIASTTQPSAGTISNVQAAAIAYKLVLDGISLGEASGYITVAEVKPYTPILKAITAALVAAENDAAAGNVSAAQTAIDEVTAALPQLAPLMQTLSARKTAATKPTSLRWERPARWARTFEPQVC